MQQWARQPWSQSPQCFVVIQSLSWILIFGTPWTAARQASLSFTISQSMLNVHWVGNYIQPCRPLSSPSPPSFNLSQHQGFSMFNFIRNCQTMFQRGCTILYFRFPQAEHETSDICLRLGSFILKNYWSLAVNLNVVSKKYHLKDLLVYFCCCCSFSKLCPTLCNPMDCSTPGSYVLHCLPEFAQIHVLWVSEAI